MATQKKTGSLWLLKDMETPYRHAHPAAFFSPGGLSKVPSSGWFSQRGGGEKKNPARNHMPQHCAPHVPRRHCSKFSSDDKWSTDEKAGSTRSASRLPPLASSVHHYPKCSPESWHTRGGANPVGLRQICGLVWGLDWKRGLPEWLTGSAEKM